MEDWEVELRERLGKEIKDGLHQIKEGEFVVYTGKQGYIDFEVELERTFRQIMNDFKDD